MALLSQGGVRLTKAFVSVMKGSRPATWRQRSACCLAARNDTQPATSGKTRVLRVAHILVPADKTDQLDTLEKELEGGADFAQLAGQHSTCGSRSKGGELGWLRPGSFYPEFESAAFSAQVRSLTRATTSRGHHLINILEERYESTVGHISVQELSEVLANPVQLEDVQLVDVREPHEYEIARLPGFKLMPLSQFEEWSTKLTELLDADKETLVLCHHGVRSMQMSQFLLSQGFSSVKNITGGIDAYRDVDSSVPMY